MADTLEEKLAVALPGWKMVEATETAVDLDRIDAQSPSMERIRRKYAATPRADGAEGAGLALGAAPLELGEMETLTGSVVVERDGMTLTVGYLLDSLEIVSIQG